MKGGHSMAVRSSFIYKEQTKALSSAAPAGCEISQALDQPNTARPHYKIPSPSP